MANDWLLLLAGSFIKPGTVSAFSKPHGWHSGRNENKRVAVHRAASVCAQQEVETMVLGLPLLWQRDKP